jgi:peptidoglycan/xylan/chitin deacetylase (PgdA/CDA1 family)
MMASLLGAIRTAWVKNQTGRLAMIDLFRELREIHASMLAAHRTAQITEEDAKGLLFLDKRSEDFYGEFNLNRATINQQAATAAQKPDSEFESVFKAVTLSTDREPDQSGGLAPSSGSSGNTNGNNFPKGVWALTYDDGPHGTHTPKILQMLKSHGMRVTFFWLAKLAKSSSAIISQAKSEGHTLDNHSYSHADLSKSSTNRQTEIVESTKILTTAYGAAPKFFRCPYGSCIFSSGSSGSKEARTLISQNKMIHVLWNVDSNDWKADTPDVIFRRTRDQINNLSRGIILFHDVHDRSYLASKKLVEEVLKDKNMVRMSDLVP